MTHDELRKFSIEYKKFYYDLHSKILMVPHNTIIVPTAQLEKNVIKVATKNHKDRLYYKRESIDTANIIEGKRRK